MNYFTFNELTRTEQPIFNIPQDMAVVKNLCHLCDMLNTIRLDYGEAVVVSSGYRCPAVNEAVGGVPNSNHLYGRAADIRVEYYPANTYYQRLQRLVDVVNLNRLSLREVIVHRTYIHIAV